MAKVLSFEAAIASIYVIMLVHPLFDSEIGPAKFTQCSTVFEFSYLHFHLIVQM